MSNQIVSIDIQKEQIQILTLSHQAGESNIKDSISLSIGPEEKENFFPCLEPVLDQIPEAAPCILSLPGNMFLFRDIDLPFTQRKRIEQVIDFELDELLPLPLNDLKTDILVNKYLDKEGARVLGASLPKEILHRLENLFSDHGLPIKRIPLLTLGSGYAKALLFAQRTDCIAPFIYVHRDENQASFYLFNSGRMEAIHTSQFYETNETTDFAALLHTTCLAMNDGLPPRTDIEQIVLSTGKDIPMESLEKRLGISMVVDKAPESNAMAMIHCHGQGLDMYNFNPGPAPLAPWLQAQGKQFMVTGILLACALICLCIPPLIQGNTLQKSITHLDRQIQDIFYTQFPRTTPLVAPVHQMKTRLKAAREKKDMALPTDFPLNIDLLKDISQSLPQSLDIVVTRFIRKKNHLIIAGSADQFNTVDKMKNRLEKGPRFKGVKINSATMDKLEKRVKFNLKIQL